MAKKKNPSIPGESDDAKILKFVCPHCDAHTSLSVGELKARRAAAPSFTPICEEDQHPLRIVAEGEAPPETPAPPVASPADEHEFVLGVLERHTEILTAEKVVERAKADLKSATTDRDELVDGLNEYISAFREPPAPLPLFDGDDDEKDATDEPLEPASIVE